MASTQTKDVFGTFGLLRFFLASCVMYGHLYKPNHSVAKDAVFVFYMMSAYVVCKTLNSKYLHLDQGILKFYANRILRIFPSYWFMLIPCVITAAYYPEIAQNIDGRFRYSYPLADPYAFVNFIANIFLISTTNLEGNLLTPQYIPPAWSVGIELLFWVIVPALLLHRRFFYGFAAATVAYFAVMNYMIYTQEDSWVWQRVGYFGTLGASMPFLLGMALYTLKSKQLIRVPHILGIVAMGLYIYVQHYVSFNQKTVDSSKLLVSTSLGWIVLFYFGQLNGARLPKVIRVLDEILGHMSYGILLVHQLVAVYVISYMPALNCFNMTLFYYSYPVVLLASLMLYVMVEMPVDRLRTKLRH